MKVEIYEDDLDKKFYITDIPENLADKAQEWRDKLVEAIADADEDLMMKYLEGEEISDIEIKNAIRALTISGDIVPVTCGAAYKNKGIQMMLDAVINYMPSPIDIPPTTDRKSVV